MLRLLTEYYYMSYSDILQWPTIVVYKDFIELVQRFQTLHDVSENSMFTVQIFDVVGQCDEELATAATFELTITGWCDGHRDCPLMGVL